MLRLQFKKGNNKASTITCIRIDGSRTWAPIHPGLEGHDLAHFVIETELGFRKAFYGLIKSGFDIGDFELPKDKKPKALTPAYMSEEAQQSEHLVNLLMVEFHNSGENPHLLKDLAEILDQKQVSFPQNLDSECLSRIRQRYQVLIDQWKALGPDETLDLDFNL